jgi:hypothetical protein
MILLNVITWGMIGRALIIGGFALIITGLCILIKFLFDFRLENI